MAGSAKTMLDGTAISHRGMMLLGYQRTKQISRRSKLAWEAGDPAPLDAEITARRDEVFAGAVAEIAEEYFPLRDALKAMKRTPKRIVDIGCGQAINTALAHKDFGGEVVLIDIEETDEQYHLWRDEGSGYASLDDAVGFLVSNGVPKGAITAINPRKTPKALAGVSGDLVMSTFSCGFHYPVGDYADLMCATVAAGGAVALDLRLRYLNRPDDALARVLAAGQQTVVLDYPKSKRILVTGG